MKFIAVILTAAWFMLAALPAAHAEPITIALFGAAFAATTAGAIVSYLIGAGIAYGISLLKQALFGQDQPTQTQGVKLTVQMGDDKPMSFIAGTSATSGKRKYIGAWGKDGKTPNAYLTDVIEVGSIPAPGLPAFWVDDKKVTVLWNETPVEQGYPVLEYRKGGKDYLWVKYRDGTQTAADPFLLAKFSTDPDRPYKSTMIGRGCPQFIATARLNQDLFPSQPQYLCETPVSRWYDVRKDSSAGGSGSHRWGDWSTYEPSDNPVVIIYGIIRGVYYGTEWVYGGQNLPAFRLPASNWMVAANECDRLIPLAGGGFEKQFRCGTEVNCDMEPLAVIEKLKKSCNARVAEVGGIFKILVGAPGAAVYSFSDGDILVTKGQSFNPFPGLSETYNGIEATYPEPLEKWATKDAPARYSADLESADRNRRLASGVTFEAVPFPIQVQRLMKLLLEEDRRFRIHSFYLPPDAWFLEPNDVVSWTSARNGYINKKFLIVRIDGERSMNQLVVLKEIDPSDYDWSTSEQLPISVGPIGPIVQPSHPMFGWQALPATFDDASGPRRPTIEVFYAGDQDGVDRIRVEVYVKDTGALWFDGELPYDAPLDQQYSTKLIAIFPANTDFLVRGIFVSNIGKNFTWSGLIEVRTPNVLLGAGDIYLPGMVDGVLQRLNAKLDWIGKSIRFADEERQRIDALLAEAGAQSFDDRKEITASVGAFSASFSDQITVVASDTAAVVLKVTQLTAQVNDPVKGLNALSQITDTLSTSVSTIDGKLTAVTNRVSVTEARVGNFYANGILRFEQVATQAGAQSTAGLSVAASGTGPASQAALFLSAIASGTSEVGITADSFYVVQAGAKRRPFIIQGGVLYADELRVNKLVGLSATLGAVDISEAVIGNLIVGTSNLGIDSVTSSSRVSGQVYRDPNPSIGYVNLYLTANMPIAGRSLMQINWSGSFSYNAVNGGRFTIIVTNTTTGEVVYSKSFVLSSGATNVPQSAVDFFFGNNAAGNNTFEAKMTDGNQTAGLNIYNTTLTALWWKR